MDKAKTSRRRLMRGQPWSLKTRDGSPYLYAVFYLPGGGDDPVWRSTRTTDEREAATRAGEIWVKEMRAAGESVPDELAALARTTVEHAVAEFLTHLELTAHEHRESYVDRYKTDLNLYVNPKSDAEIRDAEKRGRRLWQPNWTFLDEITSARWDEERLRLHRANDGLLGARSLQHLANSLRHLLRFGAAKGWIETVPELKSPSHRQVKA